MNEPRCFIPRALAEAPVIRETRLIRDLTMPERNWSKYEEPTYLRRKREQEQARAVA
jgi:hypothetical protein